MRDRHQWPSEAQRAERGDLYEEVTNRLIADLEAGRVPWVQPWGNASASLGLPRNASTARHYSDHKALALLAATIAL